jgi:AraC-like DNA-binding protein
MTSDLLSLPDDFFIGSDDTLICFYSNNKSSVKNKVVFTKNMFCLLQHGVKLVQTAWGEETITNKDLLILTSGSALMSESVAEDDNYEAILIFFGNDTLSDFYAKHPFKSSTKPQKKSILKVTRDEFLNNFCQSLQLLRSDNNKSIDDLKVQEILGYISAKYPDTFQLLVSQALRDKSTIKLKQVVDFNLNKGMSIEELSFLCDMSVSTFKRHFAAIYNMPPQRYFTQLKMEQAKRFLSLQKKPTEIYSELGYENLSAFSSEFKKHFGLSPKQFQNNI